MGLRLVGWEWDAGKTGETRRSRMRLFFLLFLTFLAVPHAGLAAEPGPPHLTGSRVRLLAPELGAQKQAGTVVEVRDDSLLFAADGQSTRTVVPTASLTELELSQGMHSHVLAGAGLGFLAGAVVGGVIGYALAHESDSGDDGDMGPLGAGVGAVIVGSVGIGVGALIGSKQTERWERQRLPISIGFLPSTNTIGLSVQVALR
jgi:hypothetical protein